MTHRILLADDSLTIRKVVELTFSDEDFTIDSVGDGAQAFEHAQARRPDIIISDVIMPGLNGYELCRRIKADPELQSVPFLFLKGTFESFDEGKAASCGSDGFIVKPFESQEMIAKVRKMIERAALAPPPAPVRPPQSVAAPVAPRPATLTAPPPLPPPQTRPATAPTAIPAIDARPAPPLPPPQALPATAPPAIPATAAHPAPPIPPRPIRPIAVPPPTAQPPLQATTPIHPTPPIPQMPHHPPAPPPAPPEQPAPTAPPGEYFGIDFGETEGDRFETPAEQPAAQRGAASSLLSSGESDEDLWSEVSLRGSASDLLQVRTDAEPDAEPGTDILELAKETALDAPEVLFEEDELFEEAPVAPEITPAPVEPFSGASPGPAAPLAVDPTEIERIVASRVEAAVRKALEPIVGDLARSMIEAVAWEIIPDLAEAMIRAEIARVRASTRAD